MGVFDANMSRTFVDQLKTHIPVELCTLDVRCISASLPLLSNARRGLIDPDTPKHAFKKKSADGQTMNLVVSVKRRDSLNAAKIHSFLTNSTPMEELFMMAMILTGKELICGTESLQIWRYVAMPPNLMAMLMKISGTILTL